MGEEESIDCGEVGLVCAWLGEGRERERERERDGRSEMEWNDMKRNETANHGCSVEN